MKRVITILLMIMVLALCGCFGPKVTTEGDKHLREYGAMTVNNDHGVQEVNIYLSAASNTETDTDQSTEADQEQGLEGNVGLNGGSSASGGAAAKGLQTLKTLDYILNSQNETDNTKTNQVPPGKIPDKTEVALPVDPIAGAWEVLETYEMTSPDGIDSGRSFSWFQDNKTGIDYPKQVRLRFPTCNLICFIEDTAHDYNYKSPRDGSKCVWYSAMDNTDKFKRGSFFSTDNCTTGSGYIEVKKE